MLCRTLTVIIIVLGGCATVRDPSATIVHAQIGAASEEANVVDFTLDLMNPNDESLKLLEVEYEVMINGRRAYSGIRSAEATLSGRDQRHIRLPAVVGPEHAGVDGPRLASAEYVITGQIRYIAPGEIARVLRDMGFPHPSVAFRGSGTVQSNRQ